LNTFASDRRIVEVVIATSQDLIATIDSEVKKLILPFKVSVIAGGASRQESVFNGLKHLENRVSSGELPIDYVLVHDAVRPLVTPDMVKATIDCVIEKQACTTGMYATDTVKEVNDGLILKTLDRDNLVMVQTPQAGALPLLLDAHKKAREANYIVTDDAAILEWAGHKVYVVPGSRFNLKVTFAEDLILAEALVKSYAFN
jgi:2-C-methyl-D-erythritol 4-phosphate cytidylyltransferase